MPRRTDTRKDHCGQWERTVKSARMAPTTEYGTAGLGACDARPGRETPEGVSANSSASKPKELTPVDRIHGAGLVACHPACSASQHGDHSAYRNHGCTCPDARRDHNRRGKFYLVRRSQAGQPLSVSAVGATRRLRALIRIGYNTGPLAEAVGVDRSALARIILGRRDLIRLATHQAIASVYDDRCTEDGPDIRARRRGEREHWHGPEAWTDATIDDPDAAPVHHLTQVEDIDQIAVERALFGDRSVTLNIGERREAVMQGRLMHGLTGQEIADRLGIEPRSVQRIAQTLGLTDLGDDGEVAV